MSDEENRSKFSLSDSLFRYERPFNLLGGVIMGLALLGGLGKYVTPWFSPAETRMGGTTQERLDQHSQVQSLILSATETQVQAFERYRDAAQALLAARADQDRSKRPSLFEAEHEYRRQSKIIKDLLFAWDNPSKGFSASVKQFYADTANPQRLGAGGNGLLDAVTNLNYLRSLPDRSREELDVQEKATLARLKGSWGSNERCAQADRWEVKGERISIDNRSAQEKILAVQDDQTVITVVEAPATERGMVYRYTVEGSSLRAENLNTGRGGQFVRCD